MVGLLACSIKMSGSKPKLKVRTLDEMFKKISESSENDPGQLAHTSENSPALSLSETDSGSVESVSSQTSESSEEKFKDTKGAIRNRISKKNRQYNGQKKVQKDKQRSTKHTYKSKDRVTRTPKNRG